MGTLDQLGKHLSIALEPFKDATNSVNSFKRFLYRMGWGVSGIPPSYMNLATKIGDAVTLAESLTDSPDISAINQLFSKIKEIYQDIKNLTEAPPGVDAGEFLNEFKDRLFEILIVDYLIAAQPFLYNFFQMVGVVELVHFAGSGSRPSFIRYKLNWSEIPKIFTEPHKLPEKIYGWGTSNFKFDLMSKHLLEIFSVVGVPVSYQPVDDESSYKYLGFDDFDNATGLVDRTLNIPFSIFNIDGKDQELGLAILKLPAIDGKLPGIVIQPAIPSEIGATLRIKDDIDFRVQAGSNIAAMFGILIRPDDISVEYPFKDGNLPDFGFGAGVDYKPDDAIILLGSENNTRLEFKGFSFDFEFSFTDGDPEVELGALLNGLAVVIASDDSDSFISKILGDGNAKIDIPLGIEWSSIHGIRFKGGAGFEVSLYPHISLGPISIPELQLGLKADITDPVKLRLEVGVGIAGDLGPLQFVVQGIGMSMDLVIKDDGNAGPFDIDLGFKPPNGIGLSIDASAVKGGGYLYFDFDKEEYAGALELTVQDTISLKAIGILNTKMPDGSKGFSLFILVTAEFSPIQLGYGFTLMGVGGLLGLNRTVIVEKLRSGVKDNSIKSIMFPEDIIANIVRILSDIKQVFPPYQGHFVIGPMGKLGWGTPTIISLELGILIEVPDPLIAILGVLKSVLPEERAPILKMQVNFLGVIDFEKKEISFDASLYDSKLLVFTLTGDMALRINWGKQSIFVLSVGGFHPDFREIPAGLTNMARLSISLLSGKNPRIVIETYFAVTSNTVQFGAKAELYAAACGFNVYGYIGFDVLFQFKPFYFIASLYAGLALRRGTKVLLGVSLSGQLSGPKPWNAKGTCKFTIIFTFKISFNKTWGELSTEQGRELADIMKDLKDAIADDRNWLAEIPENNSLNVSVKKIEQDPDKIIIHPFGVLSISQKVVPLELKIQKFGEKIPKDVDYFKISDIYSGTDKLSIDNVEEQFAPNNFLKLSDTEKLSRKSFENLKSGKKLNGTSALKSGTPVEKSVDYELSYLRRIRFRVLFAGIYKLSKKIFFAGTKANAASKSALSYLNNRPSINAPEEVVVQPEMFAVANMEDMTLFKDEDFFEQGIVASTQTEANAKLKEMINKDPALENKLQVVQQYELVEV